jgi:hypothetical protein
VASISLFYYLAGFVLLIQLMMLFTLLLFLYTLIESSISIVFHISLITSLSFLFSIIIYFQLSIWITLKFFSVHFNQGGFSTDMFLENNEGKTFRLIGLPVSADTDFSDFTERSESVTDSIFL